MATEIAFHKRQYGAAEIKAEKQHLNPGSAPSGPGDLRQAPWVIDTLVSGGKLHWSPGIVLAQTCSRGITELPDAQGKTELSLTFHLQDWAGWTPRFLSPAPRLLRTPHAHKHRHVYFHTTQVIQEETKGPSFCLEHRPAPKPFPSSCPFKRKICICANHLEFIKYEES